MDRLSRMDIHQKRKSSNVKKAMFATTAVAIAAATGATTKVSADVVASDASKTTPTTTASTSSVASTPESAYKEAQSSEASKLSDLKNSQTSQESQVAQSNVSAESSAATSNATAESEAATSQATADSVAQSSADSAYAQKQTEASEAASSYAAEQQAAKDAETAKQAQEATDFANQQSQETGSAQNQRDEVTSEYNSDVQNQKAATAQSDAAVDQKAATATDEAKTAQSTADAQANATQTADTAKANTDANTAKDNQEASYNNQVASQTSENKASEASAQKAVDNAQYNIDHPTATAATPVDSTTNPNAAYDDGHTINRTGNLPTSVVNPNIPTSAVNNEYYSDYYGETGDKDTTDAINGSATASQQKELADYAITLINSVRAQKGLASVNWSKNVEDATIASATAREKAGAGFTHTEYLTSSAKADTEAAYTAKGLTFSLENMGMTSYSELTMLTAKAGILNAITAMVYQDGYSQNGHLNNFLTSDLTMGFAIQKFNGGYILLFQGAYPDSNYDESDANNDNQELTSTTLIEADRGGDTYANREALDTANANLTAVKTANAQKLTDLANSNANAKVAIQTQLENTIATINAAHDASIKADATTYAEAIANIEASAQKQHSENAANLTSTLNDMKTAYEAKIASIKDLTPEELAAKKATELEAFQAKQTSAMEAFEAQQSKDATAFQQNLDANLAQFKAELDAQVAQEKADGQTKLAELKANNQKAYAALVKANAAKLANLKQANAIAYAKAIAESDKYLDSINPANQKPDDNNNGQNNQSSNGNGNTNGNGTSNNANTGSQNHTSGTHSGSTTTSSNGKTSSVSGQNKTQAMSYDPESNIFTQLYKSNNTATQQRQLKEKDSVISINYARSNNSASSSAKGPVLPRTRAEYQAQYSPLTASITLITLAILSFGIYNNKNNSKKNVYMPLHLK